MGQFNSHFESSALLLVNLTYLTDFELILQILQGLLSKLGRFSLSEYYCDKSHFEKCKSVPSAASRAGVISALTRVFVCDVAQHDLLPSFDTKTLFLPLTLLLHKLLSSPRLRRLNIYFMLCKKCVLEVW